MQNVHRGELCIFGVLVVNSGARLAPLKFWYCTIVFPKIRPLAGSKNKQQCHWHSFVLEAFRNGVSCRDSPKMNRMQLVFLNIVNCFAIRDAIPPRTLKPRLLVIIAQAASGQRYIQLWYSLVKPRILLRQLTVRP
jgi:hypothetical protein